MAKFVWTEEYSVGIPSIDEQHRHFFDIANRVTDLAEKENVSREELTTNLGELGNYAFYHFSTEEGYFSKFNYEGAAIHISAHNNYRRQMEDYLGRVRGENDLKSLAVVVANFSGNWLLGHILEMDKKYTVFFQESGIN
ncbi:MAG TPA: bacteriohemerythrin [Candidatus Colwellbacteria bacterium]|jgi:hemerythrin-like metal-binding protein|nr:bacteriohemerythrin [Candidatus Colwellbacteria bacterium]